jgi:hypothetical protein
MSIKPSKRKIKLSVNQQITILLALLALLLSAVTIYYSFLRVSSRLTGTVSNVSILHGNIDVRFSLGNSGNQTLIITSTFLEVAFSNGNYQTIKGYIFSPSPLLTLKAGDVQAFSASAIFNTADFYSEAQLSQSCLEGDRFVSIVIDIQSLDTNGNNFESRMPVSTVCIDKNRTYAWSFDYSPVDLFNYPYKIDFMPRRIDTPSTP